MQKNILFFQNSILPQDGGVPRVSDILAKELTKRGYKCFFVFYDKDNEEYAQQIKLKTNLNRPYQEVENSVLQFIKYNKIDIFICQNAYLTPFIKIYKYLRTHYPQHLFFCFLHANPDYWQVKFRLKSELFKYKFFVNISKNLLKNFLYLFYNPYVKKISELYNICDKFILLSDSYKESFVKLYSINSLNNKLFTIPNPLTFNEFILPNNLKKKENIVLIVSRLKEDHKKISFALRIWQLLFQKISDDWKLYIVGTGQDEDYYKKYVYDRKIRNIIFEGKKSNVIDYYQKAAIFMMTSVWEGLPMTILEAQQNGVVPIAFDNFSAIYDVISNGENGYIISNNNINLFAEKLFSLMKDEQLRYEMSLKAIESSRRFHISNIANEWEEMLNIEITNISKT